MILIAKLVRGCGFVLVSLCFIYILFLAIACGSYNEDKNDNIGAFNPKYVIEKTLPGIMLIAFFGGVIAFAGQKSLERKPKRTLMTDLPTKSIWWGELRRH